MHVMFSSYAVLILQKAEFHLLNPKASILYTEHIMCHTLNIYLLGASKLKYSCFGCTQFSLLNQLIAVFCNTHG